MESFLAANGWAPSRTESSHTSWKGPGCIRPAIVDSNYDDLPEQHIKSILRAIGKTRSDLRQFLGRR